MKKYIAALALLIISGASLADEPTSADMNDINYYDKIGELPKSVNGQGMPVLRGSNSAEGSATSSTGVVTGIAPFDSPVQTAAICSTWWVTGNHTWRWRGIPGLYVKRHLWGQTNTFYGSATDPNACSRPSLPVDRIQVKGYSVPGCTPGCINCGYQGCLKIDRTLFSTSYVEQGASNTGSDRIDGAYVEHIAEKNGISWKSITRSGNW